MDEPRAARIGEPRDPSGAPRPMTVELLAPARDLASGLLALRCGADAVYVGPPRFGARERAGNPVRDIERLAGFAHGFRARVYATVNTLLFDDEVEPAVRMVRDLWDAGVDALIVQDMALLDADLPPIPLFASTQCDARDPEKVQFLQEVGFQRVILARESSLDRIRAIRRCTTVDLEVFAHGALCAGHSGRCALSQAIGGRSANRGRCAQPCRLPWTVEDERGEVLARDRHVLSMKDLDLSAHLGELVDAGIGSFKIEGRLKDAAYVANAVAFHRRRLDAVLAERGLPRASSGTCEPGFEPDPAKAFNRGFTSFLLHGRGEPLACFDTPKSVGEPVGRVAALHGGALTLVGGARLAPGDGICWVDGEGVLQGAAVDRVEGGRAFLRDAPRPPGPDTPVYRNRHAAFERAIRAARPERTFGVRVEVAEVPERDASGDSEASPRRRVVRMVDEDGVRAEVPVPSGAPHADDPERARDVAVRQLGRAGGTGLRVTSVEVSLSEVPFLPVSAWNALRREAVRALFDARAAAFPRREVRREVGTHDPIYPERTLDFRGNVLNARARAFYERHGVERIEPAAESGLDLEGRVVLTTANCLRYALGHCPRAHRGAGGAEPWTLVGRDGARHALVFACERCEMDVVFRGGGRTG